MAARSSPLSLYCSPLMALTVKVCESSSLGEMTAPAKGSMPRGFCGRDCSLTKYSSRPASLFKTKNLKSNNTGLVCCPWYDFLSQSHLTFLFGKLETHINTHTKVLCPYKTVRSLMLIEMTYVTWSWVRTHLYCQPVTRLVYFIR